MIPNQGKDEPCSAKDNGPRPRPDEPCSDAAALFHHSAMYRPTVPLPHPPMDLIGKSRDMNTEVAGISHQGHRYEQVWKITLIFIYIYIYCIQIFKLRVASLDWTPDVGISSLDTDTICLHPCIPKASGESSGNLHTVSNCRIPSQQRARLSTTLTPIFIFGAYSDNSFHAFLLDGFFIVLIQTKRQIGALFWCLCATHRRGECWSRSPMLRSGANFTEKILLQLPEGKKASVQVQSRLPGLEIAQLLFPSPLRERRA